MEECIPLDDLRPVIEPIIEPISDPVIEPVIEPIIDIEPIKDCQLKETGFLPTKPENWTLWITSITLTLLFLIGAYLGARGKFFTSLKVKSGENTWLIAALWILVSLLSYLSFYFVRDYDECIYGQSRLLPLFLIISYLNMIWLILLYLYGSFVFTLIILGIIILINIYILIFLFQINIWAGISVIPLFIMYLYLFYSIYHLGKINNVL